MRRAPLLFKISLGMGQWRQRGLAATHINYYDKYAVQGKSQQGNVDKLAAPLQSVTIRPGLKLDEVIKLDKLTSLGAETVSEVWQRHFETRAFRMGLAVTGSTFSRWWGQAAAHSPTFLIPLPVGEGFCNMFVQHQPCGLGGIVAMSTLDEYQKYGAAAPIRLAVHAFGELVAEKDLGLLMGSFDGNVLTRSQVGVLTRLCIDLYTTSLYEWVHTFNHNPTAFDYHAFLQCLKGRHPDHHH